jgi:hypothetical protein
MCLYHFQASGYGRGADEFCADDEDAERTAFDIFIELSAGARRLVIVTVTNAAGAEILRIPRLSNSASLPQGHRPARGGPKNRHR